MNLVLTDQLADTLLRMRDSIATRKKETYITELINMIDHILSKNDLTERQIKLASIYLEKGFKSFDTGEQLFTKSNNRVFEDILKKILTEYGVQLPVKKEHISKDIEPEKVKPVVYPEVNF